MTEVSDAVATAASPAEEARYQSFDELRKAHLELKQSLTSGDEDADRIADQIRGFLAKARGTGAVLMDPSVRKAAQGIIDYWSAELAGQPDAKSDDFVPFMLAPADISTLPDAPPAGDDEASAPNRDDQRTLIRLSGTARQWRNSGRQPGYLLTGGALAQARKFADQDRDLEDFVAASELFLERKKRFRIIVWTSGVTVVLVLLAIAGAIVGFGVFANWLYKINTDYVANSETNKTDPSSGLKWLDRLQFALPPYDLSGMTRLADVNAPGLRLYAPNFSSVEFVGARLSNARLPAASFSGGAFSFGGETDNDFGGADLRQAQFRNAKIAFTSFAGADLYRAVFDRAVLCNVNFTDANLRFASFWSARADAATEDSLKNTAWWQASGWRWNTIERLASHTPEEDAIRAARLKMTSGYRNDIDRPIAQLQNRLIEPLGRALALNDLAWTDAVWGIDVIAAKDPDPCGGDGVPANGRHAIEKAVCLLGRLNSEGDKPGGLTPLLLSLRDTLAYVLMQNRDMEGALAVFAQIGRDDPKFLEAPEVSFRFAIALYAAGQDKAAAVARLEAAVHDGGYQPTHELHTLRDNIFPYEDLKQPLKESANRQWPTVEKETVCPVRPVTAPK
jgi:hypothetical protein